MVGSWVFETQLDEICLFPQQNENNSFTFDNEKADASAVSASARLFACLPRIISSRTRSESVRRSKSKPYFSWETSFRFSCAKAQEHELTSKVDSKQNKVE